MCECIVSSSISLHYSFLLLKSSPNPKLTSCSNFFRIFPTRNGGSQPITASFKSNGQSSTPDGPGDYEFFGKLKFKDEDEMVKEQIYRNDSLIQSSTMTEGNLRRPKTEGHEICLKLEEMEQKNRRSIVERRGGKQTMKRSSLLAKQVISIHSAFSLGFVSQLWVDTASWVVLVIEVRPNLLSGELERFFLEDICQVGDVVLIQDEAVLENDLQMIRLETLVGYSVITSGRQNIGKVRGYSFNITSGAVESLELDSFGVAIIPSTLVSTYALLVEDVLEVVSDTVVVHEDAALRIQRLTNGFWGSQKLGNSSDDIEDYPDLRRKPVKLDKSRSRRRNFPRRKSGKRDYLNEWELPKDYL